MVYLIDDDMPIRRAFEIFLKSADLSFKGYSDADEFLANSCPNSKDVIVLDINLPGTSGCDLLKTLSTKYHQLNVIVVSAHDEQASRDSCKEYGVKAYLRKPVDSEALIDIIKYSLME